MLDQIKELPDPILLNDTVLHVHPSPTGPQHDECRKGFGGIWTLLGFKWTKKYRDIEDDAPLHASVLDRFAAPAVLDYDLILPYRPEPLRNHDQVKHYYGEPAALVQSRAG
jgi:hypothetical protein